MQDHIMLLNYCGMFRDCSELRQCKGDFKHQLNFFASFVQLNNNDLFLSASLFVTVPGSIA